MVQRAEDAAPYTRYRIGVRQVHPNGASWRLHPPDV